MNPRAVTEVRGLVAKGAAEFNAERYWHAHEDWEEAWHALRAAGRQAAADFVQGLILVAAGFENARRGKGNGFRRQAAKGLTLVRGNRAEAQGVGVVDADAWIEAVTDAYLDACAHRQLDEWVAKHDGVRAPRITVAP